MPQILIPVAVDEISVACDRLSREVERLEVSRKRIRKIRYPSSFANELGIAEGRKPHYRGHPASAHNDVPYEILIEHDD